MDNPPFFVAHIGAWYASLSKEIIYCAVGLRRDRHRKSHEFPKGKHAFVWFFATDADEVHAVFKLIIDLLHGRQFASAVTAARVEEYDHARTT